MTHHLKLRECFALPVITGEKNFEVRYNSDRGFQKGDLVRFSVFDEDGKFVLTDLSEMVFEITYVLSGYGLKNDYVAFGIKKVEGLE